MVGLVGGIIGMDYVLFDFIGSWCCNWFFVFFCVCVVVCVVVDCVGVFVWYCCL